MLKVVSLLEQLGSMAGGAKSRQQAQGRKRIPAKSPTPALMNFDFIEDLIEPSQEEIAETFSLGRTEQCVTSSSLSQNDCIEEATQKKSSNLTYLQADRRTEQESIKKAEQIFTKGVKSLPKTRGLSLSDASELLLPQDQVDTGAYQTHTLQIGESRQVSLEIAKRINQPSSDDELMVKIKAAYEKVSTQALVNLAYQHPKKHKKQIIRINIG